MWITGIYFWMIVENIAMLYGKAEINKDEEDIYFKENNRLFKEID